MRVCAILDVNSVSFVIFLLAECNKIKSCSTTPVIDAIAVYLLLLVKHFWIHAELSNPLMLCCQ